MKDMPKYKWILIACAIAMAVVGIIIINISQMAIDHITLIVGIITLIVGVVRLIYGIVLCRREKDFYYQVIFGALSMVFGIVFIVFNMDYVMFFVLFSLCILAESIVECVTGTNRAYEELSGVGMIVVGIIKFALGISIMLRPVGNISLWVIFVGIYFVLYAATMILVTINIKHSDEKPAEKEEK